MHNAADYIKIAVIGFVGVFIINKLLTKVGAGQYTTNAA